jgi:hypothetical protein
VSAVLSARSMTADSSLHALDAPLIKLSIPGNVERYVHLLASMNAAEHHLALSLSPCAAATCMLLCVYREIQSHVSEPFWYIFVSYRPPAEAGGAGGGQQQQQQQASCEFKWARDRLFDQDVATLLYEAVAEEPITATVVQVRRPVCLSWSIQQWTLQACTCQHPLATAAQAAVSIHLTKATFWWTCTSSPVVQSALGLYNKSFVCLLQVQGRQVTRRAPCPLATLEMCKTGSKWLRLSGEYPQQCQ